MKTSISLIVLALAVATLGACNTVQGAGEDISSGGQAVSHGAKEVQKDIFR